MPLNQCRDKGSEAFVFVQYEKSLSICCEIDQ